MGALKWAGPCLGAALVAAAAWGADPKLSAEVTKALAEKQAAQAAKEQQVSRARSRARERRLPVYIPKNRGAAKSRVGAATRGPRSDLPYLQVLAPDHVGLSLTDQPTLYWYLETASDVAVNVTLIDNVSVEPMIDVLLEPPVAAGIHKLNLAGDGVRLNASALYYFYAALVPDRQRRSHDVLAAGMISFEPSEANFAGGQALAENGYWYDAVEALLEGAENDALNSLMEQVNLRAVAAQ